MKQLDVNSRRKKTITRENIAAKNLGGHLDVWISNFINKLKRLYLYFQFRLGFYHSKTMLSVKGVTLQMFIHSDFVPH